MTRDDLMVPTPPSRRQWAVALTPGGLFLAVFIWRCSNNPYGSRRFTLFDDAMISMTYGRTLATTGELVWFPGAPRVQGITNPLWTLYMALIHAIGLEGSGAALAISVTSMVLLLVTAWTVGDLVRRALSSSAFSATAGLWVAAAIPFVYPLAYWSLRGMEVGVLACALAVSVRLLLIEAEDPAPSRRRTVALSMVCAAGVATRLDFAPLALVAVVGVGWLAPRSAARRRRTATPVGVIVASALAVLAAQYGYYGDMLPNTYRLKVDGFGLWERLERGAATTGKLAPLLVVVGAGLVWAIRTTRSIASRAVIISGALLVTACCYSAWVGGDAWEADLLLNRYVSVALPLALGSAVISITWLVERRADVVRSHAVVALGALLAACALVGIDVNPFGYDGGVGLAAGAFTMVCIMGWLVATRRRAGRPERAGSAPGIAVLLLVGVTGGLPILTWLSDGAAFSDIDQAQSVVGVAMNRVTEPDAVVGTVWAGAPAYYAERPMVDFLGKSDPFIAGVAPRGALHPGHNKWDDRHSIATLRPRVFLQVWVAEEETFRLIGEAGYGYRCFDLGAGRIGGAYFRPGAQLREELLEVCENAGG